MVTFRVTDRVVMERKKDLWQGMVKTSEKEKMDAGRDDIQCTVKKKEKRFIVLSMEEHMKKCAKS